MVGVRGAGRARRGVVAVGVAAAVALLGGAVAGCGGGSGGGPEAAASAAVVRTSPIADVLAKLPARVEGAKVVVGRPEAPRTVQVLVDPRCGYCAKFEEAGGGALLGLAAEGRVKVEYLLASFLDQGGASGSVKAVNALRASVDEGKFAEYQAAVFASQPKGKFTDGLLLKIADQVPGLRGARFDGAVADMTYQGWVGEAERAFEATGAQGTPVVLVDGRAVGAKDRSMFDAAAFAGTLKGVGIG
ncbi:thioredoxin domain-containing protein [Streptomyces sp. NBC_01408]|uniref:DsbA family protein n=1 Tax=Streptomyces sp. NBC_01408 TaxID=2903855 RepID=UPI00225A31A4|nr:thioredoxin domain-containing protein [Streptomyces sp. NBC_01408]MCX4691904.1 DsbA family protein [Streptomyces sp. NBC_01408]